MASFTSSCAGNEWGSTNYHRILLTSVIFGGQLAGALTWGIVADKYGRRFSFLAGDGYILTCTNK